MAPDVPTLIEQIDFRVFVEFDEDYNCFVARCLETGAVATGETVEGVESMIKAVLENDFRIALEQGSLRSLLHDRAPYESVVGWYEMKATDPEGVKSVPLQVSTGPTKRGVRSEFRIASKIREGSAA